MAANAFDQIYCMQLAQNAVHGAMAGYTAFSAGVVNNRTVCASESTYTVHTVSLMQDSYSAASLFFPSAPSNCLPMVDTLFPMLSAVS